MGLSRARGFEEAKGAAAGLKAEYDLNTVSLQRLRDELGKTGIKTTELAQVDAKLRNEMQSLGAESNRLKDSLQRGAQQSAAFASSLSAAFESTGVRSAEQLRAEILKIDQALIRLANFVIWYNQFAGPKNQAIPGKRRCPS